MARPYSQEELIRLRESPLVHKPPGLPPVEEWMGPIVEQNQAQNQAPRRAANKGKNEEAFAADGATTRRPLFEARAKSTNVPEDIVLGPPKTAFASASGRGNANKNFDAPQRSSFTNHEDPGVKSDRSSFRDRYSRDGQRPDRDGDRPRDTRQGTATNRRSVKDDNDLWSNARQPKALGQEDGERQHRRNGDRDDDRDKEGGREPRMQRGFDTHRRDGDREAEGESGGRRGLPGRGRNEPSWYRDEGHKDEGGLEDPGVGGHRGWDRRSTRGADRDWGRNTKQEMDPEWMDAPEAEEQTQAKTSEDFEKWKKSMKSGNSTTQEMPLSSVEQRPGHGPTSSGSGVISSKGKIDAPLVVDSSFDGFFGLWHEPKKSEEITSNRENEVPQITPNKGAKLSKPSKFTGFFNPRPEPEAVQAQPPLSLFSQAHDSSNEDKEGFQRILKLLDQQQPQNGKVSPPHVQGQREGPASPTLQSPRAGEKNDLFNLLKTGSPQGNAVPQTKDSEFLLKLMQQPQQGRQDVTQLNPNGRRTAQDATPGLLPFSNLMISPSETPQQPPSMGPPPGFYDDALPRDKLNPGAERRGPYPGFFDPGKPQRPSPVGAPPQSNYPPGIQRPPGLESMSQGYAQHMQPQRPGMVPPPGIQVPSRGQNPFPPGLFPNNINQIGMQVNRHGVPPPGFMSPPPPGFPLPFSQEELPYGHFSAGASFGQGGFGQQRRQ